MIIAFASLLILFVNGIISQQAGQCHRDKDTLSCVNVTIANVSFDSGVKTVYIKDFNFGTITDPFIRSNSNWSNVEELHISGEYIVELFPGMIFDGMINLKHVGIHSGKLLRFSESAFYGLQEVTTLDLSGNRMVDASNIKRCLDVAELVKLERLILSQLESHWPRYVNLDYDFLSSASNRGMRNIKYLELSQMLISDLNFKAFVDSGLCSSLESLVIRNITLNAVSGYAPWETGVCTSLRVLDMSGSFMPYTTQKVTFETTGFYCVALTVYYNIEEYYMENVFKKAVSPNMVIHGYHLEMSSCPVKVRKLCLHNNAIQWLNISAALNQVTVDSFEWADISNNLLEYVSPKLIAPSIAMEHLDLSWNRLYVMLDKYPDEFEILIQHQERLEYLNLAGNKLRFIPSHMFARNGQLETIDLSDNKLQHLDFDLVHLRHLKRLLLNDNLIHTLSYSSMRKIDILVASVRPPELNIDLGNNPFECSCSEEQMKFVRWIKAMGKSRRTHGLEKVKAYACMINNRQVDLLKDGLHQLNVHCDWERTKTVLYISVPLVVVIAISLSLFVLILMMRRRRERKKIQKFEKVASQLRRNVYPKTYLSFLSFCSEDEQLVTAVILPKLQETLKALVNTEKDLVFRGDSTFRPGYPIAEEIIRCIEECAVIILIVSRNFCIKQWCRQEIREAYDQNKPIILLMVEKVDTCAMDKILKKIFERYTHATWISDNNGGGHLDPDWSIFCRAVIGLAGDISEEEMSDINLSILSKQTLTNDRPVSSMSNSSTSVDLGDIKV